MTLRGRFRAISVFKWGSRAGRKKTLSPVVLSLSSELPREDLAVTVVERHFEVGGGGTPCGRDTLKPGGMQVLTLAPHVPPQSPPAYSG